MLLQATTPPPPGVISLSFFEIEEKQVSQVKVCYRGVHSLVVLQAKVITPRVSRDALSVPSSWDRVVAAPENKAWH